MAPRSNYGLGERVVFHGAYKHKRDAVRKEEERRGAYIIERKIRGHRRYVVVSDRGRPNPGTGAMKFLVNPATKRAKPRGKTMAKRKTPPRYKSGPKKGQFMSKRARSAKRRRSAPKRKRTRRNIGRKVMRNPRRKTRRRTTRKAAPRRRARRTTRRTTRRNPPRRRAKMDLVKSFTDGAIEAGQILVGKAVVRSIPDIAGLPKEGNVGLAVQAAVALGAGFVAEMFLSRDAARAILAGGLTAPLETAIVAYHVPWLSGALSPVSSTQSLGAYVRGTSGGRAALGRYVRNGGGGGGSTQRGLGSYAAARSR